MADAGEVINGLVCVPSTGRQWRTVPKAPPPRGTRDPRLLPGA